MYGLAPGTPAMFIVSDLSVTVKVVPVPPCCTQSFVNDTLYLQSSSSFDMPMAGVGSMSLVPPSGGGSVVQAPTVWNMPLQWSGSVPGIGPPPEGHMPPPPEP